MRKQIAQVLTAQAKRMLKKNDLKVIVVSGSVGKTSTTQAIATVLSQKYRVRTTLKNYNSDIGIPCSMFSQEIPAQLRNPFSWLWMFLKNELTLLHKVNFDVLVLELGSDQIGELATYAWLQPEIAVVTAVAPEHMEYFKTIEAVAEEELSVALYSSYTIYNQRTIKQEYAANLDSSKTSTYDRSDLQSFGLQAGQLQVTGDHSIDAVVAALTVGKKLGMDQEELKSGAMAVVAIAGRMRKFGGISNTTLIDDSYNASPLASIAALDYMYGATANQKIVLLGNMNELGESSAAEHTAVGAYCNSEKLDLVVTLGKDANNFLAAAAEKKGCKVARSNTPYEAAEIIKNTLKEGALILIKGSQNGVFAEETVKELLANPEDQKHLVRQSAFWLQKKKKAFNR